jgi:hypothetical protein
MSGFRAVLYKESGLVVLISIAVVIVAVLYASITKKNYSVAFEWILFLQLILPILEAFRHPKVLHMVYVIGLVGAVGLLCNYVFCRRKHDYCFSNGMYPGLLSLILFGLIILAGSWYAYLLGNYHLLMVWIEKNLFGR